MVTILSIIPILRARSKFLVSSSGLILMLLLVSQSPALALTVKKIFVSTTGTLLIYSKIIDHPSSGGNQACALSTDQQIYCSGQNTFGELGNGDNISVSLPVQFGISLIPTKSFTQAAAGGNHTCGLAIDQQIYCSGNNSSGKLGNASVANTNTPSIAFGSMLGKKFIQATAGSNHTCALTVERQVYCAGSNTYGQLGNGDNTSTNANPPVQFGVTFVPAKLFTQVSAGPTHTCAVTIDQDVYCSGRNSFSGLGDSTATSSNVPVQFGPTLGKKFIQATAGTDYSCALTTDQQVYCSGTNSNGQLGDGTTTATLLTPPIQFGLTLSPTQQFVQLAAGDRHTCAVTTDQKVYCSGFNGSGQLGNGTTTQSNVPVEFGFNLNPKKKYMQLSVRDNTCATTTDLLLYCSGLNSLGQFGNGSTTNPANPVQAFLL